MKRSHLRDSGEHDYDWRADAFGCYTDARRLMRERVLRDGTYKIPPQNEEERRVADEGKGLFRAV